MRLTAQVINEAPEILNPEGKLTLLLRDLQITELENLAITQNKYQVLDLSNNDLISLGNIPKSFNNLECLLLSNNNISYIDDDSFPSENHITSISLFNNNIYKFQKSFKDKFTRLETLVLLGNPITEIENYRHFIIWLIPNLKVLDFKKVKQAERNTSESMFGTNHDEFNTLAQSMFSNENENIKLDGKSDRQVKNFVKKLSDEERQQLLKKLETATSIEEIERIENDLKEGMV
ncbi:component of U2 snRNP, putative [Candida dubliniensis CD36]|uniref:U2 small nuclear ribonucleoprotein A' n=1 Tax=Candida dubliniensis (strain CD36 / ATCC MYA-646 / CBS 7987 / NCPF 3949 / NRRL Y-17841) TaxID=573826 RepID=B9WGN3_CANDC|nr:component of U2 snRNP, putative [Candida dubliniensis CD36]CAX42409.1 component of U2 snRNP, putative [Candida dubliniensis CD36]